MRRLPADVPAWPPWLAAAAVAAAWAATGAAALVVALVLSAAGADDVTPAGVLAIALGGAVATVAAVGLLARAVHPGPRPEHVGLRPTSVRMGAAAVALGFAAVAVLGVLTTLLGHPFAEPAIPPELSSQPALGRLAHGLDLTRVDPGAAAAASLAARAIIATAVAEVLLRGLVFPALATWLGTPAAAAVVAVAFGGLGSLTGTAGGALFLPGLALGLLLCWLYAETGSVVPGVGVACAAAGASLAAGFGWTAASCAVTGLACALGALALVLPVALARPAAPVPGGPTADWDLRPSRG
jgi:trimeric autotransporter adhesin